MKCLSINIFIFNFPPVPPPFYLLGHTFNNLTCSRMRRIQVLQIRNMPHAARNNKRKRESDRKGHDQLHKSVCWGRAFYISHSAPKLETQTNTYFMYTKDYYFIFCHICMYVKKRNGWQTSFCSCCSCSCHCSSYSCGTHYFLHFQKTFD